MATSTHVPTDAVTVMAAPAATDAVTAIEAVTAPVPDAGIMSVTATSSYEPALTTAGLSEESTTSTPLNIPSPGSTEIWGLSTVEFALILIALAVSLPLLLTSLWCLTKRALKKASSTQQRRSDAETGEDVAQSDETAIVQQSSNGHAGGHEADAETGNGRRVGDERNDETGVENPAYEPAVGDIASADGVSLDSKSGDISVTVSSNFIAADKERSAGDGTDGVAASEKIILHESNDQTEVSFVSKGVDENGSEVTEERHEVSSLESGWEVPVSRPRSAATSDTQADAQADNQTDSWADGQKQVKDNGSSASSSDSNGSNDSIIVRHAEDNDRDNNTSSDDSGTDDPGAITGSIPAELSSMNETGSMTEYGGEDHAIGSDNPTHIETDHLYSDSGCNTPQSEGREAASYGSSEAVGSHSHRIAQVNVGSLASANTLYSVPTDTTISNEPNKRHEVNDRHEVKHRLRTEPQLSTNSNAYSTSEWPWPKGFSLPTHRRHRARKVRHAIPFYIQSQNQLNHFETQKRQMNNYSSSVSVSSSPSVMVKPSTKLGNGKPNGLVQARREHSRSRLQRRPRQDNLLEMS